MTREYLLQPTRRAVRLQIDYSSELNPQQLAAATAPPGPALVIAGAGAGKTRTLTYRVAYLLEQGILPERILLLTFTNKAAREMMRRVADLLGSDLTGLWGGTFHAVGNRILRRHADRLGYARDFTILDREDARDLIRACIDDANIDVQVTRFPKADVLGDLFSLAANTVSSLPQILDKQFEYFTPLASQIEDLHRRYRDRKRATGVMDFDDLLVLWRQLLEAHPDVREHYQRRFEFILVDEYQDTNKLQGDLVDCLAAQHRNVTVVGDDSQSIYSWRGANFRNILEFPRRYPAARVFKIETNYRSSPQILLVANAAIAANTQQFAKELAAVRPPGPKPVKVTCGDGGEQAAFVAQRALELRDEGVPLDRMAVLYRSHFHALELQLELTRRNIPFRITSGIRFFEQAHIKDAAAHLKLIVNPRDELAFKRLVRLLPGIGGKTADRLWHQFRETAPAPSPDPASRLRTCATHVPKKASDAWGQLVETIVQLQAPDLRQNPAGSIELVLEAGYQDYLRAHYANARSRIEDLQQLAAFARQFATTEEFLSQLALLTDVEVDADRPAAADTEQLQLTTIHQAKGLEFDVVFVIMLCDGLFPSARSLRNPEDEEEERRLFYVAITRARNELYLSYPLLRAHSGRDGGMFQDPSRFLLEIPEALVDPWNLRSAAW